jgi:hypothetical protein
MQIIIVNKFYSKNKYILNEIYLILLKTQSKLLYYVCYVCYALKYVFSFNNFCFYILFSTPSGVAFYAKVICDSFIYFEVWL